MNNLTFNTHNIGKMINIAGRQRMLSQKIAFLVSASFQGFSGPLNETMKLFEQSHSVLVHGNHELPSCDASVDLRNFYLGSGQGDQKIQEYLAMAKDVSQGSSGEVLDFFALASKDIVPLLDQAVNIYQKISVEISTEMTNKLSDKDRVVRDTLQQMSEIARQTKLISFNSSIIAARAGEVGKEFSVVGVEINKLIVEMNRLIENGINYLNEHSNLDNQGQ